MSDEKKPDVTLYISSGCGPCEQVKKLVTEGKFNQPKVDVIDVAEEKNFHFIEDLKLNRVPTAMKNGETCSLSIEDDVLMIDCPGDEKE